jgi:hypothetical protein
VSNQEVSRSEDVKYGRTTVGTSAVPISIRFTGDETEKLRRGFLVKAAPDNSATIFLGGPTVTAEDGMPLLPGHSGGQTVVDLCHLDRLGSSASLDR